MKKDFWLVTIMILQHLPGVGQIDHTQFHQNMPVYFVDSMQRDMSTTYINPDNIQEITVARDTSRANDPGKIFVKLKNPKPIFRDLGYFCADYDNKLNPVYFLIDGVLIKDSSNVIIDESDILKVSRFDSGNIKYIPTQTTPVHFLVITTRQSNVKTSPNSVHLR